MHDRIARTNLQMSVVQRRISALCTIRSVGGSKTIGSTATSSFYDGLNPVQELQLRAPSANTITGLGIDEYFQRTDASGASSYLTDALDSTLALANSAGGLATSYTYDPFGNTAVAGSSTNPFQFTGRENDGTGLYYYRARYYRSANQRFIAQDPIEFAGGDLNLYSYASNSPANLTDPMGEQAVAGVCEMDLELCNEIGNLISGGIAAGVGITSQLWRSKCSEDDRKKTCDNMYYNVDIPTCRGIARVRSKQAGQACYASAADRYAACLAGRPIPPLNTWNN